MITCIILSAGLSERFGHPKALALLDGIPVINRLQETLLKSSCDKIIVVLGADTTQISPSIFIHSRIHVVYNKHYNFGQTSSLQAGWQAADEGSEGIMFLPVDCPLIQASSIDTIIHHFKKDEPDILIPTYQNKKGHPPVFHTQLKNKFLEMDNSVGLNILIKEKKIDKIGRASCRERVCQYV